MANLDDVPVRIDGGDVAGRQLALDGPLGQRDASRFPNRVADRFGVFR
jgi:hypothetical protein